jgi:hypothetical protein
MEYLDFHVIFIRQDWRLYKRAPFDLVPFWYHDSFFFALGLCGKNKQRKTRTNMSIPRDRGGVLLALLLFFCIDNAEAQTWTWIGGSSVADSDSANAPVKGVPFPSFDSNSDQILCILWDSVPERLLLCVPEGTGLSCSPNSSIPFIKLAFGEALLIQPLYNLVFLLMRVKKLGILNSLLTHCSEGYFGKSCGECSPGTHFRQGTICQNPIWKWFGVCIVVIIIAFVLEKALSRPSSSLPIDVRQAFGGLQFLALLPAISAAK